MYISKGYIRGIEKEKRKYYIKETRKNFMKTLGRALLWVSGVIFIMFGSGFEEELKETEEV